jgi:hypothetical protein
MTYMISRDGQEFGPYSLSDLQRYVATGDILPSDMARSEGMYEFLPVSQIIGTIPVPVTLSPISLTPAVEYPNPPNLHWGLVLLFGIITFGLFDAAWGIVLGIWMRKVDATSRAIYFYAVYAACLLFVFFLSFIAAAEHTKNPLVGLIQLVSFVITLVARYSLRNSLEKHYNDAEPMGLVLSGVMTFFFSIIYFQYHLNDIVRRKKLNQEELAARTRIA